MRLDGLGDFFFLLGRLRVFELKIPRGQRYRGCDFGRVTMRRGALREDTSDELYAQDGKGTRKIQRSRFAKLCFVWSCIRWGLCFLKMNISDIPFTTFHRFYFFLSPFAATSSPS